MVHAVVRHLLLRGDELSSETLSDTVANAELFPFFYAEGESVCWRAKKILSRQKRTDRISAQQQLMSTVALFEGLLTSMDRRDSTA
jgi:hypothetical protein